jgi:hypothetical protein
MDIIGLFLKLSKKMNTRDFIDETPLYYEEHPQIVQPTEENYVEEDNSKKSQLYSALLCEFIFFKC